MRTPMLILLLLIGAAPPAYAQASVVSLHQQPEKPAAAAAPAIIPGSALAALTSAATPPAAQNTATQAPFGTDRLAFFISGAMGQEAARDATEFLGTIYASIRPTPIIGWLKTFGADAPRRAQAAGIGAALFLALLPAILADAALSFALRRPASQCALWARPRQAEKREAADAQGLADAEAGASERTRHRISLRAWSRILVFALLKFCLALLPLAGFAIIVQILLVSGLINAHPAALAVTGIANAYLVCRAVQELARLLIAPSVPGLRLIAMPDQRAQALMHWLLLVLSTVFAAYSLVSCADILGLPRTGTDTLVRIAALVVHLQAAMGIWQSRQIVGGWIAGDRAATGVFAQARQRLGAVWQFIALFYVVALWAAWAGGIQNAFFVLLRAVLVLLAALIAGRLAWGGTALLLERVLPDPEAADTSHLVLIRARAYHKPIRAALRLFIGGAVLIVILQGWGVNVTSWFSSTSLVRTLAGALLSVLFTIGAAVILWESGNIMLHLRIESLSATAATRQAARLRTLAPILRAASGGIIAIATFVIGLSEIGVNTTGLLAISSIAGIAVGFGSQKLVQDIITGLFMLLEDAIQVGDVVTLAGMTGTVERLSIRTIRLRALDGSLNIIPFSAVTTVTNMTRDFSNAELSINIGYEEDVDRVYAVLNEIGKTMRADPVWGAMMREDLQIFGLDKFGALGLVITAQIRTGPGQHWAVRREFYRRVQKRFGQEGIIIPNSQQLVLPAPPPTPAK